MPRMTMTEKILAKHAGKPAIVRQGKILATTFHPELTSDTTVHEYFLKLVSETRKPLAANAAQKSELAGAKASK